MRIFNPILLCFYFSFALLPSECDAGTEVLTTILAVMQARQHARQLAENARQQGRGTQTGSMITGAGPSGPGAIPVSLLQLAECNPRDGKIPVEMYKQMMACDMQDILAIIPTKINGMQMSACCPYDIGAVAKKVDANHDGKLSAAEQMELLTEVLAKFVDQNRDRCVTKAELEDFGKKCGA